MKLRRRLNMGWRHWIDHAAACKKGLTSVAVGLTVALAGVATSLPASAQITGTKHNLGTSGVSGNNQFSGTGEICVFCHTPHGATTSAVVPLWNRTLPTPSSFTTYDSLGTSSLDGKVAPVGSISIACLSCHDGVTAMSAVINAPGSGLTNATFTGGVWSGGTVSAGTQAAGGGIMNGVAALGADLRNDHPIGIQYAGGGYSTAALTGPGTDVDFNPAENALVGTTRVWWVETGVAASGRQKTDMALYTRVAGSATGYTGQTNPEPFVECASCHDPHTAANPTFLRISNTGSKVCLACHIK
jgi:predicted CXXCH cytochrome family protein